MFLTGEGALLALALAAVVSGLVGVWALLCLGGRRSRTKSPRPGQIRRIIVPPKATRRV
jgi:hypothetical protein